jgi:hypothetical protein
MVRQIQLTESNSQKVEELSRQTGKTPEQVVNEAVEHLPPTREETEQEKFLKWREAAMRVAGIWADRDDLPDFEDIRRSMDRDLWDEDKK